MAHSLKKRQRQPKSLKRKYRTNKRKQNKKTRKIRKNQKKQKNRKQYGGVLNPEQNAQLRRSLERFNFDGPQLEEIMRKANVASVFLGRPRAFAFTLQLLDMTYNNPTFTDDYKRSLANANVEHPYYGRVNRDQEAYLNGHTQQIEDFDDSEYDTDDE